MIRSQVTFNRLPSLPLCDVVFSQDPFNTPNRRRNRTETRVSMEKGGLDSAGREFKNAEEMWREQLGEDHSKKTEWYEVLLSTFPVFHFAFCAVISSSRWWAFGKCLMFLVCLVCLVVKGVEASTNGVLGGYAQVNEPDIMGSEAFLKQLLSERFPGATNGQRHLVVLDCGSGIG
ncbi:hypothetical protein EV1_035912 [Malus domestica]